MRCTRYRSLRIDQSLTVSSVIESLFTEEKAAQRDRDADEPCCFGSRCGFNGRKIGNLLSNALMAFRIFNMIG